MKYYIVFEGKNPGVYSTLEEYNKQIKGEKNSYGKSINSQEKLYQVLHNMYDFQYTDTDVKVSHIYDGNLTNDTEDIENETINIYTDGSCSKVKETGIGVLIMDSTNILYEKSTKLAKNITTSIASECYALVLALRYIQKQSYISVCKDINIYCDCQIVLDMMEYIIQTSNQTNLTLPKFIKHHYDLYIMIQKTYVSLDVSIQEKLIFHKVKAHSANIYNNRVDWLAKKAVGIKKQFGNIQKLTYINKNICLGF